jgi:hypothetical protein
VDRAGQAIVAGIMEPARAPGLEVTPDALQTAPGPGFLLRLDPTGSTITYASYVRGTDYQPYDGAFALATDPDGNVYVAGSTAASDFPLTPGAYYLGLRARTCREAAIVFSIRTRATYSAIGR